MKKTLLSVFLFTTIGIYSASGQITVDSTNIVTVGENVYQAYDSTLTITSIGSSGANQTWNFSNLGTDRLDTLFFRKKSSQPFAANFPSANMVMTSTDPAEDSTWSYLNKSATGLDITGQVTNINSTLTPIPILIAIVGFPITYGTNYSGNWNGTLFTFPIGVDPDGPGPLPTIDSMRIRRLTTYSGSIDAWGNVTTPLGTFPSLRQNQTTNNTDSTFTLANGIWSLISPTVASIFGISQIAKDTTNTARWWTNDASARFPLVEIDYNTNGTLNNANWLQASPTVGINESTIVSVPFLLYPSPAKDIINIATPLLENATVKIIDITGKELTNINFSGNKIRIPITNLDNGIYFYTIYNVNGDVLHTDKFIVAK